MEGNRLRSWRRKSCFCYVPLASYAYVKLKPGLQDWMLKLRAWEGRVLCIGWEFVQ
jgi:hypothetical protein